MYIVHVYPKLRTYFQDIPQSWHDHCDTVHAKLIEYRFSNIFRNLNAYYVHDSSRKDKSNKKVLDILKSWYLSNKPVSATFIWSKQSCASY